MYPANFFGLFPPFPRDNKIFVAMSFDSRFDDRWKNVLEPAINSVHINEVPLEAVRVDARRIGDSVITEILDGISRHKMVIADVTTIGYLPTKEDQKKPAPIRNANVMYEVGLAHAVRLPEEILMFRSDNDNLNFDISNIRVNSYNPDTDPKASMELVGRSIISALKELDLKRHFAVRQAVDTLDHATWLVLAQAQADQGLKHPTIRSMRDALGNFERVRAISKLLEIGAIRAVFPKLTPTLLDRHGGDASEEMFTYKSTDFGTAVSMEASNRLGIFSSEMQGHFESEPLGGSEEE